MFPLLPLKNYVHFFFTERGPVDAVDVNELRKIYILSIYHQESFLRTQKKKNL